MSHPTIHAQFARRDYKPLFAGIIIIIIIIMIMIIIMIIMIIFIFF